MYHAARFRACYAGELRDVVRGLGPSVRVDVLAGAMIRAAVEGGM